MSDPGRLEVRVDSLRVAPWMTLLQATVPVDGRRRAWRRTDGRHEIVADIRGSVVLQRASYRNTPFPEFRSEFTYADRRLRFQGDLRRNGGGGAQIATLNGELPGRPFTRRFGRRSECSTGQSRSISRATAFRSRPLAEFVEAFSSVSGEARGKIGIRGTWTEPRLEGAMAVDIPALDCGSRA